MIAFLPTSFTLVTALLLDHPFCWVLLLIPFSQALLIYSMNRFTDKNEDRINVPERLAVVERYGLFFLFVGITSYIVALSLALWKNILTFIIALFPFIIAILYSSFRMKKYFIIKNILIGKCYMVIMKI